MVDYFIFLLQWVHVLFAVYLIGSGFFFELFVKPQLQTLQPQDTGRITMAIADKFAILVYVSWIIVILSGLYRAFFVAELDFFKLHTYQYGIILETKMGIVAIAFIISLLITKTAMDLKKVEPEFRPPLAKRMSLLAKINIVMGILIIFLAVALRNVFYL